MFFKNTTLHFNVNLINFCFSSNASACYGKLQESLLSEAFTLLNLLCRQNSVNNSARMR
jgi:hypothetical protein